MDKNNTILIIDDSSTTLLLLEWSLNEEGYNTQVAASVKEAQNLIHKNKPALILLDLSMPVVSGYDFLKMRSELDLQEIPIIVVSAFDNKESIKSAHDLGAAEFIAKPFTIPLVITTIKKHLK
jgi:two-component system, sensor histidine kinase and response regulator